MPDKVMQGFNFDEPTSTATVGLPEHYSYGETLAFLNRSPAECLHAVENNRIYKLLDGGHGPYLIEVSASSGSLLAIRFVNRQPRAMAEVEAAVRYVREWLDLDTDLSPFYHSAQGDPLLSELIREFAGLRIIGLPDLFEAMCWAVMGQQVNVAFAYAIKKQFVEAFGTYEEWNGRCLWLFPKPDVIAQLSVDSLKAVQLTSRKAECVIDIAQRAANGTLSKERLLSPANEQEIEQRLVNIRGVGPWTAHYVMMRCLRIPTALPAGDVALQNALKLLLRCPNKPTPDEVRHLFKAWSGFEAYTVFYLWKWIADLEKKKRSVS